MDIYKNPRINSTIDMGVSESLLITGIESSTNDFYQVFPNPCNNYISFVFQLKNPGTVSVNIYNVKGEKVKNSIRNFSSPDTCMLNIDLTDLQTGIYFYQLIIDGKAIHGKISVM